MSVKVVACSDRDMQDGEMKKVDMDGTNILVIKHKGHYFAVGSKCTHYGAPLVNGSCANGFVRCPWHGASFDIATGDIEDFPGLDSLPKFETKIEQGNVVVIASKELLAVSKRLKSMAKCAVASSKQNGVVIVGGGAAAASAAETLRQEGYSDKITVLSQELHLPYDRPKLSKVPNSEPDKILLRTKSFYEENGIDVHINTKVTGVNVQDKVVSTSNGSFPFNKLIIATGGSPRKLACPGADLKNVFYLRGPEEGSALVSAGEGKNVVVIGSSFIGMELASFFAKKAASTTVIGQSAVPFERVLGADVGKACQSKLHEANGVKFHMNAGVKEIQGKSGAVSGVVLDNGSSIPADVVLVGIGVIPATSFLQGSGIEMTRGFVPVDKNMATNVPDVYACGDIVTFPLSIMDDQRVNVQHWQMALKHGRTAGLAIAGNPKPIHSVPFFWTVLFGKSIRYAGYGVGFDKTIMHGSLEDLKFICYYMKNGTMVAVATLNRDPVAAQLADVLKAGKKITEKDIVGNEGDDWKDWL